jgi:hypothetical protein
MQSNPPVDMIPMRSSSPLPPVWQARTYWILPREFGISNEYNLDDSLNSMGRVSENSFMAGHICEYALSEERVHAERAIIPKK